MLALIEAANAKVRPGFSTKDRGQTFSWSGKERALSVERESAMKQDPLLGKWMVVYAGTTMQWLDCPTVSVRSGSLCLFE